MKEGDFLIVQRAILLAAGFGSRMQPITINTPKPLVRVNGHRIIDTIIDACLDIGIDEIYIVRGYLGEQFDQLLHKYPNIKFIENPNYQNENNISSVAKALDLLPNSYIFEADLLISNPKIIKKEHEESEVLGIWKEKTNDWCLDVDVNGFVSDEKENGEKCYQMVGIYYFNDSDGKKLAKDIREVYTTPSGKQRYWETVPNQTYRGEYKIKVSPCNESDVIEIDTYEELCTIDPRYIIGGN